MSETDTTSGGPRRILIARHPTFKGGFYDCVLKWLAQNHPRLCDLFQPIDYPNKVADYSQFALHVPWLQDPVQAWSQETYDWADSIAAECDKRGIPVNNRVDRLLNAAKFAGAQTMRSVGIHTPRMALIDDPAEFRRTLLGMTLPLFLRENWGHWSKIFRADTMEEVQALPIEDFKRPLAVEVIDVRDPRDGLYRKYRYIAAGDIGVSHHMQISSEWITRGENRVYTDVTRKNELDYVARPDPHHELFQRARKAMGLDFVAFDYAYDPTGRMVTWEANPFPIVKLSQYKLIYRNHAIHRTIRAMVAMYLRQAGLPVPEQMAQRLLYEDSIPSSP
jgi:hypothetical protein